MSCLFCDNGKSFTTQEHIIPESLGNNDFILEREVCDKCQKHISKIENYVLNKTPIGFWRTLLTIRTKKNKLPFVDFSKKNESKGVFPDYSSHHDNIQFHTHPDFTTELVTSNPLEKYLENENSGKLKCVITPKVIFEIGKFLGKVGIEIICHGNREKARLDKFKDIRKYVREGSMKGLWPIFHTTEGDIKSLFEYFEADGHLEERITCYSYKIFEIEAYIILNLLIGTDSWFICLNRQFPHPDIVKFMGENVNAIWYSKDQWKSNSRKQKYLQKQGWTSNISYVHASAAAWV